MFKAPTYAKVAALAAGLAIAAPAVAQEPGLTPTTIKIGMFGPLSGPSMAYGFDVHECGPHVLRQGQQGRRHPRP